MTSWYLTMLHGALLRTSQNEISWTPCEGAETDARSSGRTARMCVSNGFASGGTPGHSGLPAWPQYDDESRTTMILGRRFIAEDGPLERERVLYEEWSQPRAPLRMKAGPGS